MKNISLILLMSSLLIQIVFGQQPVASTSQKAPAHGDAAPVEPNAAPDKFHQLLARSNGAWTGQATMNTTGKWLLVARHASVICQGQ